MHPIPTGDSPSPSIAMARLHLPPLSPTRSNVPMLYYGVLVVGTAAVVLALFNLIIVKWWWNKVSFGSSFKYKRGDGAGEDSECVVCLSVFEEGVKLRQLPKCNHSFHAACIDMWLYSHMDCPLCRCAVELPGVKRRQATEDYGLVPVALV